MNCIVGLDLGQQNDFTAISVLDVIPSKYTRQVPDIDSEIGVPLTRTMIVEAPPLSFHVTHLERLPIGTSYVRVVERVRQVMASLPGGTELVVDNTGVGRPVTDMILQQGLNPVCITITGGETVTRDGRNFHVPKRDIVSVLAVAFQNKQLKIAKSLPEAQTLVSELLNFKVKINLKTAHDSYAAWREGTHDDLILSVGLAAWAAHYIYTYQESAIALEDNYQI